MRKNRLKMKHSIVIGIAFCLTLSGCESWMEEHLGRTIVDFQNNAEYEISVYSILIPPYSLHTIIYPDTNLPFAIPRVVDVKAGDYQTIYDSRTNLEDFYKEYSTDTISLFVFSTELMHTAGWDSIRNFYAVLQRYDISLNDFRSMFYHPTFPPTEEMRNIKMWPPYGTYDSTGQVNALIR